MDPIVFLGAAFGSLQVRADICKILQVTALAELPYHWAGSPKGLTACRLQFLIHRKGKRTMTVGAPCDMDVAGNVTPAKTKQALLVTCDKELIRSVELALQNMSWGMHVATSVSDALDLHLERFLAITLDESIVTQRLSDVLDQLTARAPQVSLLVACDTNSRRAIKTVLATDAVEWITKPVDDEEVLGRLHRFERQRRLRSELEDSLYFIRRVADATPEMLYLFDVQDKDTIYINREVCSVLGWTPQGISPEGFMLFESIAHRDDSERVAKYLTEKLVTAKDGEVVHSEYRILDRHHRWRWIRSRETVFHRDEAGHPKQILGTAQDITDRRELEQTQALLAAIVGSLDDAVIGKTLNGEIISWNEAAERIYGYTKDEVVGRNISILVPPDYQNEVPGLLERIRGGQGVDHYETTRRCKDGKIIRVSITISPIKNREGKVSGASTIARRL